MPYGAVHIPAGSVVKIGDNIGALTDLGVLKGDSTIGITYDEVKVEGSQAEKLVDMAKNMEAEASFTLYQLYLPNLQKLLDGIATVTVGAGAPVTDHQQVTASGAWAYLKFIPFDGKNASGAVPTNITLTGSTDGLLTVNSDYFVMQNEQGVWGFYVKDTAPVTTLLQSLTAELDYTPAASVTLKMGAKSATLVAKVVEFTKTINAKIFRVRLWSAVNKGGLTLAFPDSAGDEPASIPITLSGGLDTTKATGEQLVEIYDEIGLSL